MLDSAGLVATKGGGQKRLLLTNHCVVCVHKADREVKSSRGEGREGKVLKRVQGGERSNVL